MIYKVLFDGLSIYESDGEVVIKDPSLSLELNSAGSFQFKLPPMHNYYDYITPWNHDVEVYEGEDIIFFGRPTNDITIDMNLDKTVYCEGALAFFNDSIQRPAEWNSINLKTFVETLISNHNEQVSPNRRFQLGKFPNAYKDKEVYRVLNYETTFECLSTMLLDTEGGYLLTRKENGVQYLDWIIDFETGRQPVQYGLNIVDLKQSSVDDGYFTVLIPLGQEIAGVRQTISSVNDGLDYINTPYAVSGELISRTVIFDDAEDAADLLKKAKEYMNGLNFNPISITVQAAELHYIDYSYAPLRLGERVHVYSKPHNLEANLPIVSMNLNLATASKTVTIGTIERRDISEIIGPEGQGYSETIIQQSNLVYDPTPTRGSNNAVTSSGIYEALGDIRFTVNADRTIHVEQVK